MQKALVLGGGGPVGIAWETGVLAGLEAAGVSLTDAESIIGTSAGSFVGAQLAAGGALPAMYEAQRAPLEFPAARSGSGAAPDLTRIIQMMAQAPLGVEPTDEYCAGFGAYALESETIPEEQFLGFFAPIAPEGAAWPARYACTAIDAESGAFRLWRAEHAVPLAKAIASSCAVPGIYPTISINGRRYLDGGMRSPTNADQAAGAARVVVLSVSPPAFADYTKARMAWEIDAIAAKNGRAHVVFPDAGCGEAFGPNLMDPSRRQAVAEAGFAQGQAIADQIGGFWRS